MESCPPGTHQPLHVRGEIRATAESVKEILSLRNRCSDMSLPDADSPTRPCNNIQGTMHWSKGTSTKGIHHINLKDCAAQDSIQADKVTIHHTPGVINPIDIFTTEMRTSPHVIMLCDLFMMSAESFRSYTASSLVWMSASWVSGVLSQ